MRFKVVVINENVIFDEKGKVHKDAVAYIRAALLWRTPVFVYSNYGTRDKQIPKLARRLKKQKIDIPFDHLLWSSLPQPKEEILAKALVKDKHGKLKALNLMPDPDVNILFIPNRKHELFSAGPIKTHTGSKVKRGIFGSFMMFAALAVTTIILTIFAPHLLLAAITSVTAVLGTIAAITLAAVAVVGLIVLAGVLASLTVRKIRSNNKPKDPESEPLLGTGTSHIHEALVINDKDARVAAGKKMIDDWKEDEVELKKIKKAAVTETEDNGVKYEQAERVMVQPPESGEAVFASRSTRIA